MRLINPAEYRRLKYHSHTEPQLTDEQLTEGTEGQLTIKYHNEQPTVMIHNDRVIFPDNPDFNKLWVAHYGEQPLAHYP
jgi:hypothetical protein